MITAVEIRGQESLAGGAEFGASGAYTRLNGTAFGELDPLHPGNRGIALLDQAPRNAAGKVEYRSDFVILHPADPARGNGRMLYEVNNRGRIMLFANLCAGAAGNTPRTAAELGNALPLRLGFSLVWSGWDPGAPKATGLSLDAPVATDGGRPIVRRIREEFVSGTRLGALQAFRLSHEAASRNATLTVRRAQTAAKREVPFAFVDARSVRLLPEDTLPEQGSIYELHYDATQPRVLGIGFAATRDLISHLRRHGGDMLGRAVTHTLAFGISQAGRYLRDHIAQGFNADEHGARVFDGVFTHVAGIGRVFHNTPFAQPFRTRTWHEDHDFPEVEFPFSSAVMVDPISGASGALLRGEASDPKLIETNTSTEYWQKGASLLHTDPLGTRDAALPANVRGYLLAGTQHGGKANMPRDKGPCVNPRNWHDPMPAIRALLVALDEWVVTDRAPPDSRLPRIADGSLVPAEEMAFPAVPGLAPPHAANDVAPLADWTQPQAPPRTWRALVPQVDADGNERAGIRLPDIAVPRGTFTGWNHYAPPYPEGEPADRDGTFLAFAETRAARERAGDPRPSLAERYADAAAYAATVRECAATLLRDRLLLAEDAERYGRDAAG
ncbi:MAG TPA: alpha/beta hydrolase domain-containing protein [Acetobacteraceae bacterium]|nr:alpha/beta hydrolase domain-containing protein [Acetobacteraceae bacterium]